MSKFTVKTVLVTVLGLSLYTANVQAALPLVGEPLSRLHTAAQLKAARFLSMATFGPSKTEINQLAGQVMLLGERAAFELWIERQFALEPSYHESLAKQMILDDGFASYVAAGVSTTNYPQFSWWHRAITAPDQLRQRMAWALSQIFVTSRFGNGFTARTLEKTTGEPQFLGVVHYYDMLLRNAFGNYRDLLGEVTLHPVMGVYLSHLNNPKATENTEPDENFAREVQQLFSIGLYELKPNGQIRLDANNQPIASYDNADIRSFSRVFTGLGFAGAPRFGHNQANFHQPMVMHDEFHDTEAKTLHNGTVLPAGQTGMQDINAALDNLFKHPNTSPFMARLLIQRFVKSNPSKRYIRAVSRAFKRNLLGQRGDLKAVLKAILLHEEALQTYSVSNLTGDGPVQVAGGGTEHSRLQEPVLRYAAFLRAFDPISEHPAGYFAVGNNQRWLNQAPYYSPSVFNFYLPNHTPAGAMQTYKASRKIPNGSLHAPELQIFTTVIANELANRFRSDVSDARVNMSASGPDGRFSTDILLNFSEEEAMAGDVEALLTHLNLLLCRGLLGGSLRGQLAQILSEETDDPRYRAWGGILALLTAPDCAVHE